MNSEKIRKLIVVCFHFLLIVTPFFFTWFNEELFEFPKMLLVFGMTVIIVSLWIARMILEKQWLIKNSALDWPLILFVISQTLSTIFSIHPHTSIWGYYTRFHGGLLSTLAYVVLFYALISNLKKTEFKSLLTTTILSSLGVAFLAIPEHFGKAATCLVVTGQYDVACWQQDVKNRVYATFGQPNWLAAYAITLIPLGIILTSQLKKKWLQLMMGLTTLSLFLTLIYTKSRSGLLGLGIGLVVLTGGYFLINKHHLKQKTTAILVSFLVVFSLMALIAGTIYTPSLSQFLKKSQTPASIPEMSETINRLEVGGTDSGEIRQIVWQGAINIWRRYPILGSGVETFAYSYYQDRPLEHNLVSEWDFLYNKAHNEFLNFLATSGIVGLVTYLILLSSFTFLVLKFLLNKKINQSDQLLALTWLAGISALSVSNFFGFSTVMVAVLMFVFFAGIEILKQDQLKSTHRIEELNTVQLFSLLATGVIGFFMLIKIVNVWRADYAFAQGKQYFSAGYTQAGVEQLQQASQLRPSEALFHNQLADTYSQISLALYNQDQATASAQFAQVALAQGDQTLKLNARHLNFYKTQARVLLNLAVAQPELLSKAQEIIEAGLVLAPTDAKLMYNLGLIQVSQGQTEAGIATLKKSIEMRPNYDKAKKALEELL